MDINSYLFPSPSSSYTTDMKDLIWVPVFKSGEFNKSINTRIPCRQPIQVVVYEEGSSDEETLNSPQRVNLYNTESILKLVKKPNQTLYDELRGNLSTSKCSTTQKTSLTARSKVRAIPCIYLDINAKKTLIYFHANGEDLGRARDLIIHLSFALSVNVLAVEYPGYGIYKEILSVEGILEDAEACLQYLTDQKNVLPKDIILCGRSIGTGPACYIAANHEIGLLIMITPFLSIQDLIKDKFGKILCQFVKQTFDNKAIIQNVKCPVFIVHGMKDEMIPIEHARQLAKLCKKCRLVLPADMDHDKFDFVRDLVLPLTQYYKF